MDKETTNQQPAPTAPETTAATVPESAPAPEPEPKKKEAKTAAKKAPVKPHTTKKESAPTLTAVGRQACKLNKLAQVWVAADGQCFAYESDAKNYAASLKNNELIKVTA